MKPLQTNFVQNADKCGNHRFIQIRKEKDVALYRRETMEGKLFGFEVFRFKTIKAGSPLPGGGTVQEDYESYPGGKAFGRNAWFVGGVNAETRSMQRFEELMTGSVTETKTETDEIEETVPVIKVSNTPVKEGLKIPEGQFTQKELAAANGFYGDDYKKVYSDLQKMLARGVLRVCSQPREVAHGKPAKQFERVG